MSTIIKDALDRALESGRNLVIVGPGIGKSTQIEEWCKEKSINLCNPIPFSCSYRVLNEKKGILVLDDPTCWKKEKEYPKWIEKIQNDPMSVFTGSAFTQNDISEILFSVVVLSEYDGAKDHETVNNKIIDHLKEEENWEIIRLDYDKESQLSYFIQECEKTIKLIEAKIAVPQGCEQKKSSIEEDYQYYKDKLKIWNRLMESPLFDTKYINSTGDGKKCGLSNRELSMIVIELVDFEGAESFYKFARDNKINECFVSMIVKVFPELFVDIG